MATAVMTMEELPTIELAPDPQPAIQSLQDDNVQEQELLTQQQPQPQPQPQPQLQSQQKPPSRADRAAEAFLGAYGWNPDSLSFNASSALLWTLKLGDEEPYVVDYLLRRNAELYLELNETVSSLQTCVEKNRYATAKLLLAAVRTNKVNDTHHAGLLNSLLCTALNRSHSRMAALLLDAGASPNMCTTDGFCALSMAVRSNMTDLVQRLLESGAKLHEDSKATFADCLYAAVVENDVTTLELLESSGINLSEYLYTGKLSDPMRSAAFSGCAAAIEHLLSRYPDTFSLHMTDVYDALKLSVEKGKSFSCQALLEFPNVDIEVRDKYTQQTLLWLAVEKRQRSTAVVLLKQGADIHAKGGKYDHSNSLLDRIMRWDPSILEHMPSFKKPGAPPKPAAGEQDVIALPSTARTSIDSGSGAGGSTGSWFRKFLPSSANSNHSDSSSEVESSSKGLRSRASIISVRKSRNPSITVSPTDAQTEPPLPPHPPILPAFTPTGNTSTASSIFSPA